MKRPLNNSEHFNISVSFAHGAHH